MQRIFYRFQKASIVILLSFVAVSHSNAQTKTYIGIKGGPQVGSIYMDHTIRTTYITPDFIPGYTIGLVGKVFTKKRRACQPWFAVWGEF